MKTAMELIGDAVKAFYFCNDKECEFCHDKRLGLELVVKRAREEMQREAQLAAVDAAAAGYFDQSASDCADRIVAAIRALPVE